MYFIKKIFLLLIVVITPILIIPSFAMMPEKQANQTMGSGDEESVWKTNTSFDQRLDMCKEIVIILKNEYQGRDDLKGISFYEIYTEALDSLHMLTEGCENSTSDFLEIFMDNLTTNLSLAGELLKFEKIPLEIYKRRKAFSDKIYFAQIIIKKVQTVNIQVSSKVFLTFDRHSRDSYDRVSAHNIAKDDKMTTFRTGIYDKANYTMVGYMDLALASTYNQSYLDNLGIISFSSNPHVAFLGEIWLDLEFRGQGYSKDALKLLNELLDAIGAEVTYLQVVSQMPYTASIYKKAGYILTEKSLEWIQENSYIEEDNKRKKLEIKKEVAECKFLKNSSISKPYMIRYRYGVIPTVLQSG